MPLVLASPAIPPGGEIPSQYTCDGADISPPLTWSAPPRNDFGKPGYSGPCPPKGHGVHHYHFGLLAISRPALDLTASATALDVLKAAQPYVIERTELVGTYHR